MTPCQELVKVWIFPSVQLVDRKFPHRMRLTWAVLVITRALVRPPENKLRRLVKRSVIYEIPVV